jgi:EipB-like
MRVAVTWLRCHAPAAIARAGRIEEFLLMEWRFGCICAGAFCASLGLIGPAGALDLAPNRALYTTSLSSAKQDSGVVGAEGSMAVESGETCDGWTVEEHDKLVVHNSGSDDLELVTNFVSWESKDGLRFRFSQLDDEVSGEATLDGPDKGGKVEFTKPKKSTLDLAPGVLFPTGHTIRLIERAAAGDHFVSAKVLDGASADNASDVSAVIGAPQTADATAAEAPVKSPLLQRPSWRVHLAFFPADGSSDKPDYELDMRLLDNGVSRDMVLDYGDFAVKAKLDKIEVLPKPSC